VRDHEDRHAHVEVLVALTGEGWYGLQDRLYPMRPGTVMLFDSHEPHQSGYPDFAGDQDHLWFSVVPAHLTARLLEVRKGRGIARIVATVVCEQEDVGVSLQRWAFAHADKADVPASVRRARLLSTVGGMVAAVQETGLRPMSAEGRRAFQHRILATVRRHVQETAGKGATLEHLARIAGYSKFHFHRLFREDCGETVQQYVDRCRQRRVAEALERGVPKKQISAELGFSCSAAFSRWLRSHRP
jgi:AraC-like DNA-binding protein